MEFRKNSQKNPESKNNPTREDQQSCHKIPNFILSEANDCAGSQTAKDDITEHAYSSDNIIYSSNNPQHTKQEYMLGKDGFTQESVKVKGGQIENSLYKLHNKQKSEVATACITKDLIGNGPGYTQTAANFDKREFNNPSEKIQIDRAREKLKK
ncbi:hypothetical protein ACTFIW_011176 [Dictyostelium discoideum]